MSSFLELNAYLTGALSLDEVRILMEKEGGDATTAVPDTITGLESKTHFGRPQFDKIFKEIAEGHTNSKVRLSFPFWDLVTLIRLPGWRVLLRTAPSFEKVV